jgi:hypothetical protein
MILLNPEVSQRDNNIVQVARRFLYSVTLGVFFIPNL